MLHLISLTRDENGILKVMAENERQKKLDDQYIESFLINTRNQPWINLTKEVVNNGEETIQLISSMGNVYDLYIVGRGQSVFSPLTFGLSDWGDCPGIGNRGGYIGIVELHDQCVDSRSAKGSTAENEAVEFSQHSLVDQEPIVNRKSRDEGDQSDHDRH
ncbi:hypothetical protein M0R45_005813 [Rubus argutus]|uniref:Uncharacterized protein n=1 Tax=Rubus argutus TaxID=59490 RepID=A0AAW1YNP9_RUBAR